MIGKSGNRFSDQINARFRSAGRERVARLPAKEKTPGGGSLGFYAPDDISGGGGCHPAYAH